MKKVKLTCMLALLMTIVYSQVMLKTPGDARLSPRLLNYQGYLTDASGIPITDPSVSMTFTIYDALSNGNQKWTETQPSVSIDKGVFSVILGSVTPIPDTVFTAGSDRWLELTVEAQTLSPRTRIVSSAYAYTSTYSDTADYARNAVADNDWSFLISDGADTTLQTGGRWGITRLGNTMYGNADSTHTNFGVACTTGTSGQNRKYCTVGGGFTNKASSGYATVGGGVGNVASGYWATVGGGNTNSASGQYTTVGGGYQNSASGNHSTVGGGYGNYAVGSQSMVGGGYNNGASKQYAAVGGGWYNFANGYVATISGGEENAASNDYATVGGGRQNTASGDRTTIGGGANNTAGGYSSVIGGGRNNSVNDSASIIGGGYQNQIAGQYSAILGGYANTITATGDYSYLFGINSNLTQDSTFMVDLPHIRFGTEATGYEFPVTDGSNGQALVTDGSGQVSWVSTVDTDWSFLVSDGADTTLQTGGHWGIARAGNTLYGNADSTHVNLGVGSTTGSSGQDYKYITVGGGYGNIATYNWTTIGGGDRNTAGLSYATVGGGVQNNAGGQCATVGGGSTNIATSECATVAGGNVNTAGNYNATVSGGQGNIASGYIATVGGGKVNRARGDYSVVNGGGGPSEADSNSAIGNYSAIGGGRSNIASVEGATVGGGLRNTASGIRATVGGGLDNIASGLRATVGGGYLNTASFQQATVGGGYNNIASGVNATVGGGENNITNQLCATVGGGYYNYAAGAYSAILGGYADSIAATGDYSYLFGINSNLAQDSTFMVDLPHIRFGTEATGYEFPVTDGSNGQALVTDGSGQVSWVSTVDTDWSFLVSDGADTTLQMGGRWGLARYGNTMYGNADSTHVNLGLGSVTGRTGEDNKYCTVSGGMYNTANRDRATVGGGWYNTAGNYEATVGGGTNNNAGGNQSTIAGGAYNVATDDGGTIGGGYGNTAASGTGFYSVVGGGQFNAAGGYEATIGGGEHNTASGNFYATVGGGYYNTASGDRSTVSGGVENLAAGAYSAILGGYADTIAATGDYSYLFGINSNLTQDSTFMVDLPHIRFGTEAAGYEFPVTDGSNNQALVTDGSGKVSWGSPADADWTISGSDMYSTVSGNVGIGTATPNEKLHVAGNIEASGFNVTGTKYYLESSGFRSTASPADWYMKEDANDLIFITADAKEYVRIENQTGRVGIGTTTPTAKLDVSGPTGYDQIRMRTTYTPSSSSDPNGNVGDVAWDDSYVYIKTSAGWKRSALTTW